MIGYYVHHVGRGHRHRAAVLAAALDEEVVGLSSAEPPAGWPGDWVRLAPDDTSPDPRDPTAGGALHWVPANDPGLRSRMATLSGWLDAARPRLVVVDVSVEVALLVRLHGVPVVSVLLPGDRSDPAHRLGATVSDALVGFWPPEAHGMVRGLDGQAADRLQPLGALSRLPVQATPPPRGRRVVVMGGAGGVDEGWADALAAARQQTPDWRWTVLGRRGDLGPGADWVADPAPALQAADVVVTHAGQNALAEVAAARRPAVVVPQVRPHDEQAVTGSVLAAGLWPAVVEPGGMPHHGWRTRLETAALLDGADWAAWCDGKAARRFADVVDEVLAEPAGRV